MTIDEIYRLVQTFANKEQRGFITPTDFNLLAKQAELELYNKRLSIMMEKSQPKKSAGFYAESLTPELAEQDIASFLKTEKVTVDTDSSIAHVGSSGSLLTDYIVSISTADAETQTISTNVPVEIVNNKNINQILRSSLVKPSASYPIALIGGSASNAKVINVFPDSIKSVTVNHYVNDSSPKWSYVTIAGKPVYDVGGSTQFKFSNRVHGELVVKILEYLGVTIREVEVVQYAQNKEATQDN
ncbi:hypothetical protein N9Z70_06625 [Mariniblastus sp.]|nr:hypothetical protein [Mariniblastus sp.]